MDHSCLHAGKATRVILFANGGGAAPLPTPPFLKAMDACKRKQESGRRQHRCLQKQASGRRRVGHSCLQLGKLRGSFCLQMGALRPSQPPRFLRALDACKRKRESGRRRHGCLHQKTSIRLSTCGSFMFCIRGKLRGSFCLQIGGAAHPPTPPLFKGHGCFQKKTRVRSSPASMLAKNKHQVVAVWVIHACTRWKLPGSFCLQMWGGCAPPNPPAFKGYRCLNLPFFFFFFSHCFS